jgi:hypothetical protein
MLHILDNLISIGVSNVETNAWAGTIEFLDSDMVWMSPYCFDCTGDKLVVSLVADGNGDSDSFADTQCNNGDVCELYWGN